MNTCKLFFSATAIILLVSCADNAGKEKKESADKEVVTKDTAAPKPRLSKDNKPNIRVSREDSLKVLSYAQLQAYMPQISGYKKGLTGGETLSNATSGGRQSYARQEYENKTGKIIIEIVDYSLAQQTLRDLMKMYEKNGAVNSQILMKKEQINEPGVTAISEVNKTDNFALVRVNVSDRYLINIGGNDKTNTAFLRKVAESIRLKKLKEEKI